MEKDCDETASSMPSSSSVFHILGLSSGYNGVGDKEDIDQVIGPERVWKCDVIVEGDSDRIDLQHNLDRKSSKTSTSRSLLHEQQPNTISTTKYTLVSWLPVSILEQFKRVANFYFLVISILMIIGTYNHEYYESPLDPGSTVVTLVVVLLISSVKEGYEDYERYRYDCIENEREVIVCTYDKYTDEMIETRKQSREIKCGEIIKLEGRTVVPADIILIHSSTYSAERDLGSRCYVETSNIDGETNLKPKEAPPEPFKIHSAGAPPKKLFDGYVEYEGPTKNTHNFVGALHLKACPDLRIPLSTSNLLLRSSIFSNTDWGYGIAVYTGRYTKVRKQLRRVFEIKNDNSFV